MNPEAREIKNKLRNLRADIHAEGAIEYARRSKALKGQLEELAFRLYNSGMSIVAVGQEMGTKHWKTTKDLIDAAQARRSVHTQVDPGTFHIEAVGPDEWSVQAWEWTSDSAQHDPYTGLVGVKVVRSPVLAVVPITTGNYDVNTPLHAELADWRNRTSPVVEAFKREAGLNNG